MIPASNRRKPLQVPTNELKVCIPCRVVLLHSSVLKHPNVDHTRTASVVLPPEIAEAARMMNTTIVRDDDLIIILLKLDVVSFDRSIYLIPESHATYRLKNVCTYCFCKPYRMVSKITRKNGKYNGSTKRY